MYDFVTFIPYFLYQRPWVAKSAAAETRATLVERTKTSVTYAPVQKTCAILEAFKAANIQVWPIAKLHSVCFLL